MDSKLINELNSDLYDRTGEVEKMFSYETNGYVEIIKFDGIVLWDSENDDRGYIDDTDEKVDLKYHICKTFNELVDKLDTFRFELNNLP